jgi:hypothetical protein
LVVPIEGGAAELRRTTEEERMTDVKRDEHGDVDREKTWAFEERRLRRREVYAQELMALAIFEDDPLSEVTAAIRQSAAYKALAARLGPRDASPPA